MKYICVNLPLNVQPLDLYLDFYGGQIKASTTYYPCYQIRQLFDLHYKWYIVKYIQDNLPLNVQPLGFYLDFYGGQIKATTTYYPFYQIRQLCDYISNGML